MLVTDGKLVIRRVAAHLPHRHSWAFYISLQGNQCDLHHALLFCAVNPTIALGKPTNLTRGIVSLQALPPRVAGAQCRTAKVTQRGSRIYLCQSQSSTCGPKVYVTTEGQQIPGVNSGHSNSAGLLLQYKLRQLYRLNGREALWGRVKTSEQEEIMRALAYSPTGKL